MPKRGELYSRLLMQCGGGRSARMLWQFRKLCPARLIAGVRPSWAPGAAALRATCCCQTIIAKSKMI